MNYFLWYDVFQCLDFCTKLSLGLTSNIFQQNYHIADLMNLDKKYLTKLNQNIIQHPVFRNIKKLKTTDSITDISFLKNLKTLDISCYDDVCYECKIDQMGIQNLDLYELNASCNSGITNLNHLRNLKKLDISNNRCAVDQSGIAELNLQELNASDNWKIMDISYMTNLKILWAYGRSGIFQNSIRKLNLQELYISGNYEITDTTLFANLKILVN